MGHKDSTAETYATENDFPFHNIEDPLIHHEEVKPTCTSDGNREYWHCDGCNWDFSNAEGSGVVWGDLTISKFGHNLTYHEGKLQSVHSLVIRHIITVKTAEKILRTGMAQQNSQSQTS